MSEANLALNVYAPQVVQSDKATGGESLAESGREALLSVISVCSTLTRWGELWNSSVELKLFITLQNICLPAEKMRSRCEKLFSHQELRKAVTKSHSGFKFSETVLFNREWF